jgi:hypothetical protein
MLEAKLYETTRRKTPEDSHLHTRYGENLKSHQDFSPMKWDRSIQRSLLKDPEDGN